MFRASRGARFPLWVTAFILASAALVAGITLASAHGGDAAKVHSCVNKFTGLIRIIPANGSCTLIENPLDWSQGGGAGPSGPSGPSGPTGPAGQLNGVREYTSSSSYGAGGRHPHPR